MTTAELDAIRQRLVAAKTLRSFTGSVDDMIFGQRAMRDVEALLAEVERLTAEVESKVTQNVALIGQNGRLQQEVERLTVELHRMKSRPVEAEFSRLDTMWQQLVRERDEAIHELRRLKGDRSEVNTAKLNDAFTEGTLKAGDAMRPLIADAFARGVAAMRVLALNVIDCDETEWRCHGDLHAERIRALPDPEDKS